MQVVIPMSGRGSRFAAGGIPEIKPLIPVDGRPMISHVVEMFPSDCDFVFICARDHLEETELREVLRAAAPEARLVAIEPHKRGPVHSVLEAREAIEPDLPTIVNYCDFSVVWDFGDFEDFLRRTECEGCVTAYRGFHPHSLGPNLYAYMRSQGDRMLEIREKHCFTENRMSEFASSGCYYFRSGSLCLEVFSRAVEAKLSTGGEFYVSSTYQLLLEQGLDVRIYELEKFLQWGTPEDLREYQGWSHAMRRLPSWSPGPTRVPGTLLLPMAGAGRRFRDEGYEDPKPLISVAGTAMVRRSLASFPEHDRVIAVCQQEHLQAHDLAKSLARLVERLEVLPVEGLTEGQACTCLLAADHLDLDAPLTIAPCDTQLLYDPAELERLQRDPSVDCLVWSFRNHPHANRNPHQYGWLATDGGRVTAVSCKQPLSSEISSDFGIIGAFWFRRARDFVAATRTLIARDLRVNGEFYVDSILAILLEQGKDVRSFPVDHYLCLGTPDDVRTFEYWYEYFHPSRGSSQPGGTP